MIDSFLQFPGFCPEPGLDTSPSQAGLYQGKVTLCLLADIRKDRSFSFAMAGIF